ncbi:MAG TPA: hypothetical protein VM784_04755 [Actinomycetota bacterium]|nr:hypothetical protein [Actinomycetota bacterium]
MLDRALSASFRHFATVFLIVAVFVMPLHVAFSYWQRDVIAVSEIHDDISTFPDDRRVQGVGRSELERFRAFGALLAVVELLALPILIAAARRTIQRDREGKVPTVADAWRWGVRGWTRLRPGAPGLIGAGLVLAGAVIVLARGAGMLVVESLPQEAAWAGRALAEGGARALGGPFFLVPVALATFSSKDESMD